MIIKDIIYDIIISVLVLGLLVTVAIPLFRGNMDIIASAAERAGAMEKAYKMDVVGLGKTEVLGSDVISVIRYYSSNGGLEINVTTGEGVHHSYFNETYEPDIFYIGYEEKFEATYFYDGDVLKKVEYVKKN
ncbi:MAG TPA: hypothetical protein GXX49_02640 [Clostridiaceae bacterium]|nr:hypothetical protein [Clostridiaceae bacterium]